MRSRFTNPRVCVQSPPILDTLIGVPRNKMFKEMMLKDDPASSMVIFSSRFKPSRSHIVIMPGWDISSKMIQYDSVVFKPATPRPFQQDLNYMMD